MAALVRRDKVRYSCRPDRVGDAVEAQEGKAVRSWWMGWGTCVCACVREAYVRVHERASVFACVFACVYMCAEYCKMNFV
jgi:hypothetical protein